MDSELRAALDRVETTDYQFFEEDVVVVYVSDIDVLTKWARKCANPDIETAAEVLDPYMVHPLDVMEATKATVNAALGINGGS